MKWEQMGDYFHNSIALLFFILIVVFPFYSIWVIKLNMGHLQNKRTRRKFGRWYEDLDFRKGATVLMWPTFYVFRRIQLAATVVFVDIFIFQTFSIILQLLFAIIFVGYYRPWLEPSEWKKQLASETLIMIVYYHLMCFTPFLPDHATQKQVGWSVISIVALHLVGAIAYIFFIDAKVIKRRFKLWRLLGLSRVQTKATKELLRLRKAERLQARMNFKPKF